MADYTWKQWEAEQNDSNLLHAADCERWQAGIELAGGTWDGSWTDLDTSGKGLITIGQFNALESQIQSKVSSYTPKGYDPDSTVQIVPGPDGWNRVEDGILRSVCTPDGVAQNILLDTKAMSGTWWGANGSAWTVDSTDEDGFTILKTETTGTGRILRVITSVDPSVQNLIGKTVSFSIDFKATREANTGEFAAILYGSNNGTSWTLLNVDNTEYVSIDDFSGTNEDTWTRLKLSITVPESLDTDGYGYAMYRYGGSFRIRTASGYTCWIRAFKMSVGDETGDWSPAPEDFGYGTGQMLSASPQSVEDSDEVAAPEAEEIE